MEQQGFAMKKLASLAALTATLVLAGCRQDMQDQPKFVPQRGTTFFADGRSARPQVANTVARNQAHEDAYFYTGVLDGKEGDGLPIALTPSVMARGQERYNIYCAPCHSRVGNGAGMIVQRGYRPAGNYSQPFLMTAPIGHFFAVMTNGYGAMPDYAAQLTPEDRWAVAAYIRALQLSQNAKPSDVPAGAHVEDLHAIAQKEGMPPGFADPWSLPTTAIYGTPDNQDHGIPGEMPGMPPGSFNAHNGQAATGNSGGHDQGAQKPAPGQDTSGRPASTLSQQAH
jgi:mono/diheme cytochrome c family protein